MSALIARATLQQIEQGRNDAVRMLIEAHELVTSGNDRMTEAFRRLKEVAPLADVPPTRDTEEKMFAARKIAAREEFERHAIRLVDADAWSHLVKATDLQRLMDKKAKDELRAQLVADPAPFTEENATATLERFALEAGDIFRRGIAEVFSALDRRFRSHDGFKIGARVIIKNAFDSWGTWNYYARHRDTLQDIDRTFHVLDGKMVPLDYAGIVGAIDEARRSQKESGARQSECETDYYRARVFMNGNVHLWFRRDDLVEQINKMLAEYYGEVVPDGRQAEDDGGLHDAKRSMARNFGFFPSPEGVVARVIEEASLWCRDGEPPLRVLEPSAGTGNLAMAALRKGARVDCIEIQAEMAASLSAALRGRAVVTCADFLNLRPMPVYDRVVMNPPFDRERDIDHVMHALGFLKPGGRLVSVMSAHTEFAETRKATAFRGHVEKLGGAFRDLPARSFAEVGTNVNAIILTIQTRREP